jgi:uncharacterized membrane protein
VSAHEAPVRGDLAERRLPPALRDYLRLLAGAAVGFGLLTGLLGWLTPLEPELVLPVLALVFSAQAASYAARLARDPGFRIPDCGCGADVRDDSATVLRSPQSRLLGVHNAYVGVVLYAALTTAAVLGLGWVAAGLVVAAAAASAYLGWVMVARLGSVCSLCINVAALNLLLLVQLVL